jgi:hypothetical protein
MIVNLRRKIRRVLDGLNNLFVWAPTIYRDRNWDYVFIYEILQKKLELTAKYTKDFGSHTCSDLSYQKIMLCIRLIEKVKNEDYLNEVSELNTLNEFDEYLKKHKSVAHRVILDKEHQIWSCDNSKNISSNVGIYNHHRARRLLFTLLEKRIEYWWE